MSNKIFILDTNVLLHDSGAIYAFGKGNDVVIPIVALEELDTFKRRQDEVGRNSRAVTRELDKLRETAGHLAAGVELPSGGVLRIEMSHHGMHEIPAAVNISQADNRILGIAWSLKVQEEEKKSGRKVHLITKDINLRVKADAVGVITENYENRTVDIDALYTGHRTLPVPGDAVNEFYRSKVFRGPFPEGILHNEFVMLQDEAGPGHTALGRYDAQEGVVNGLLLPDDEGVFGIRPLNKEQRYAMELLMDDKVQLVALVGMAGTGKTLIALAAGLQKVVNEDIFRRLLVSKPIMPMGKDIGYLPGDIDEKLMPRMQSVADNLEYLFMATGGESGNNERLQEMMEDGIIELEPLTYIRGRSIPFQYMVVDEAQNLTPLELKTVITRAGKGSKIILCGDPYQIDHPYLDSSSNGLSYVVECFKGEPLFGSVTLTKGERSPLAEMAARKM